MMRKLLFVLCLCLICLSVGLAAAEIVNVPSGDTQLDIHEGNVYAGVDQNGVASVFYFTPTVTQNYYLMYTKSEADYPHIWVTDTVRDTKLFDHVGSDGQKSIGRWITLERGYRYKISVYRTYNQYQNIKEAGKFTFSICTETLHADVGDLTDRALASCTEEGYATAVCKRCSTVVTRVTYPALGHDLQDWHTDWAPTCAKEGRATQRCRTCLAIVNEKVLEKVAHTPSETMTVLQAPTCVNPGYQSHVCTQCMTPVGDDQKPTETDWIYLAPKGHTPAAEYVVVKAATCTKTGRKTLSCTECGMIIEDTVIPKLDHTWSKPVMRSGSDTEYQASCLVCGEHTVCTLEMWNCENCGTLAHGEYCWNCGTQKKGPLTCVNPDCGMVMPEGWTWPMCPSCGTKLPTD